MGLIENIKENFTDAFGVEPLFKAVMFGDKAVYLEGVSDIKSYSLDKVEVKLKTGEVVIKGENLSIEKYCVGDLAVCGKIKSLERI